MANNTTSYDLINDNLSRAIAGGGYQTVVDIEACHLYSFAIYTVILGSLCILGVLGNLVAYVVFWRDTIKTSTTFLFQGLSMIDTVLLVTAFPIYVLQPMTEYLQVLESFTYIQPYILVYILPCTFTAQTATIWVTVLVGFNRYIAVCKPYQASRLCNISIARKYLCIVLFLSFLYNIPRFAASKIVYMTIEHEGVNVTIPQPEYTQLGGHRLYMIIYNNVFYLLFLLTLPLLTLTILNVRLINALKEIKRRRMEMQSLRQQQDNNVTFVLIIVVLVFMICQLPALINQVLWNILADEHRSCGGFQYYFSRLCNLLVIVNSAINFLIYFLFNKRFRTVFLENLCKGKLGDCSKKTSRNGHLKTLETTQTLL